MKAKTLLTQALQGHYALGAFNAANLETLKAICLAAQKNRAPILIEASPGEAKYVGIKALAALAKAYEVQYNIPIVLNLDHGQDPESLIEAIEAGFDYVHVDGSKLPFEENVKITAEVVKYAHAKGVIVEGEIDHIEGSSADHTKEDPATFFESSMYTKPEKAKEFVERTQVDTFASFIGNLHGIYAKELRLNFEILTNLKAAIPNTFLSLHGGSGINAEDVHKAISLGIVKVNVNSELRVAFKNTLQNVLNESTEIAVYKIMEKPIWEVQKVVEDKIKLFGSNDKITL